MWERNPFIKREPAEWLSRPAEDWDRMLATGQGSWSLLQSMLVQLNFPVRKGVSGTTQYIQAMKKGIFPPGGEGLILSSPGVLRLFLQPTPAGRVPVIQTDDDGDFVRLMQALAHRNEPVDISAAQGGATLFGVVNWGRARMNLERIKNESRLDTMEAFEQLKSSSWMYKDDIIILSGRNYSGISAQQMGLAADVWREKSKIIRLNHESAHFVTKHLYGSAQNLPHDELIADFMGITAAFGRYEPDYFLLFMGLEDFPAIRKEGRLGRYTGELTADELKITARMLVRAARRLGERYRQRPDATAHFHELCGASLAALAGESGRACQ